MFNKIVALLNHEKVMKIIKDKENMKLVVGKSYINREGKIVNIIDDNNKGFFQETHPYIDEAGLSYTEEGKFFAEYKKPYKLDLVKEYKPESKSENTKFWMVYSPQGKQPTYKHHRFENAEAEAKRLAYQHADRQFYVLEAVEEVSFKSVQITKLS